jgi:hypothetical protein
MKKQDESYDYLLNLILDYWELEQKKSFEIEKAMTWQ